MHGPWTHANQCYPLGTYCTRLAPTRCQLCASDEAYGQLRMTRPKAQRGGEGARNQSALGVDGLPWPRMQLPPVGSHRHPVLCDPMTRPVCPRDELLPTSCRTKFTDVTHERRFPSAGEQHAGCQIISCEVASAGCHGVSRAPYSTGNFLSR